MRLRRVKPLTHGLKVESSVVADPAPAINVTDFEAPCQPSVGFVEVLKDTRADADLISRAESMIPDHVPADADIVWNVRVPGKEKVLGRGMSQREAEAVAAAVPGLELVHQSRGPWIVGALPS